ncbi:hypothetical protein [Streptomyces formicae]|nr:hypothetical protein [Streptomyces formicae]
MLHLAVAALVGLPALFSALPPLADPDWRQWAGPLLLGGPALRARDA